MKTGGNNMRRCAVLGLLLALLALSACSKASDAGMHAETKNGVTVYDGTQVRTVQVTEGQTLTLQISVARQAGSLSISVLQIETQTYAYRGIEIPSSSFDVLLTQPGAYQITVQAEHFQGSYEILDTAEKTQE